MAMNYTAFIEAVEDVAAGAYPVKGSLQNPTNEQMMFWKAGVDDTMAMVSKILRKALADVAQPAEASALNTDQVSVQIGPSVPNPKGTKP